MEKEYSLQLEESTRRLVEEAFSKQCRNCGKPATRIIDSKHFCHECATPYNAENKFVPHIVESFDANRIGNNTHLVDDEYW
jgi:protein-arginine kinase activator protein McsA